MRHKNISFLPQNSFSPYPNSRFRVGRFSYFHAKIYSGTQLHVTQMAGIGGMDMQKKIFLSAALGLAIFANTAFAEVNTAYLANELRSYPGWPLEVYCNATDVNVRTQPNTDCDVITILQR